MPPEFRISSALSPGFAGRHGPRVTARLLSRHVELRDPHVRPAAVGRVGAPSPRRAAECPYAEALQGAPKYLRTGSGSRVRFPVHAWLGPATAAVAGSGRPTRCSSAARMARGATLLTRRRRSRRRPSRTSSSGSRNVLARSAIPSYGASRANASSRNRACPSLCTLLNPDDRRAHELCTGSSKVAVLLLEPLDLPVTDAVAR